MTAESSLNELQGFNFDAATVAVLLGMHDENGLPLLQMANLNDDVAGTFRAIARSYADKVGENEVLPYDSGYQPSSHQLSYVEVAQDDQIQAFLQPAQQVISLQTFSEDDGFVSHLAFYALVFENSAQQKLIMFRHTTKSFQLDKGRDWLVFSQGQFNKINDRAYAFDREIDCFSWDGFLYISGQYQFERIFQYIKDMEERATSTLNVFVANVPILNEDALRDAVSRDSRMMGKLARISKKPYVAGLTIGQIKAIISSFHIGIDVHEDPITGVESLVFSNDPQRRWKILTLLDDGFLRSQMTNLSYEVNSKSVLSSA